MPASCNLFTHVSCKDAVIISTICQISKDFQDVMVKITNCVIVMSKFATFFTRELNTLR